MNPETQLKGLENIKYVWTDESQNIGQDFWTILNPTIRRNDSLIILSLNPLSEEDPVHTTYIKEPRPQTLIVKVNIDDNRYATEKLLEDKAHDYEKLPADDYSHIWEGAFLQYSEAQVFRGKFEATLTEPPPAGTEFYYGIDWGDKDPTAMVRCWVDKDWNLIIDRCWRAVGASIEDLEVGIRSVLGTDNGIIRADTNFPTNNRQMAKLGFNIRGALKGPGSIKDGIMRLKRFNRILIHDQYCKDVLDEFKTYKYEIDKMTNKIGTKPADANNHFPDAVRYALSDFSDDHPSQLRKANSGLNKLFQEK
jgi:phage terminase large subunit